MSAIANVQTTLHVDARLSECLDFVDERGGIDDHAGSDDGMTPRSQNSARDELENIAIAADNDGVAGIVTSGYASDVFEGASEVVHDFAFSFIAPLRAYPHDRVHF